MNKNTLLKELKAQIYDREKYTNIKEQIEDLELEKKFIEKDILFRMREVELLQKYIFLNENYDSSFLQIINEQVKNEFFYSEDLNKSKTNKKVNSIGELKKCKEIFLNNEYLLCNYLYNDEFNFVKDLLDKSRKAYKDKNLRLLKLYEDIAKKKFYSKLEIGTIDEKILKKSIEKVKNETRNMKDNNKILNEVFNDVKKLEKLRKELKEILLMSLPENKNNYIM
ncbi:hypothetical protein [Miniphocaeibacter massiliensis]|uniref:hypothetical protein n=1 Tax=Miniphocaeibacter massiliensis TaxID=2041841 RepID=UPI000C069894|nr:hypothetical protein [Miniphocaeibacter massiliensis]